MITHDNTRENERDADTTRRRFLERADRHCEGGAKSLATSQRPGPPREVGGGGGRKKARDGAGVFLGSGSPAAPWTKEHLPNQA